MQSGAITRAQLDQALAAQRTSGALLGQILLELNFVTEESLSRALASEAGVPFVIVNGLRPDPAAVALVPERFARQHLLAPVGLNGSAIEVLQANPFDVLALDDLQRLVMRPVTASCATMHDVRNLLERCYTDRTDVDLLAQEGIDALSAPDVHMATEDSPVARLLELLVNDAIAKGATDLHVEPEEAIGSGRVPNSTIRQTQIRPKAGFTFATAIRSLLRQDPDVIMIGEIRDPETAQLALRAALSGILVFSSLHTQDSAGAVPRLMDMGLDRRW
jgi:type II secretory ATPase GspE/PulE/Tfp pilus assembly ATPase PilB-like protein